MVLGMYKLGSVHQWEEGGMGAPSTLSAFSVEPEAPSRWGRAAGQPSCNYGWKDRHCLQGMEQPMGGEGSEEWAMGNGKGEVTTVSKDLPKSFQEVWLEASTISLKVMF